MFKLNSHPNDNINILIIIKQTPQKNVKKPSSAFKRETKYKKTKILFINSPGNSIYQI